MLVSEKDNGVALINWPADMVAYYQSKFFEGYALNRAWQEIPLGALVGVVEAQSKLARCNMAKILFTISMVFDGL